MPGVPISLLPSGIPDIGIYWLVLNKSQLMIAFFTFQNDLFTEPAQKHSFLELREGNCPVQEIIGKGKIAVICTVSSVSHWVSQCDFKPVEKGQ